jgi:hypothetical protein
MSLKNTSEIQIPNTHITGNTVENFIAYKLSKYCLVRRVSQGTDIGVDLYCELLRKNPDKGGISNPLLHFWVQVKSSGIDGKNELIDGQVSIPLKVKHLKYWRKQPVPIFVMYANREQIEKSDEEPKIFVLEITRWLFENSSRLEKEDTKNEFSIRTHRAINNESEWSDYVNFEIESIEALQKLENGIVSPISSTKHRYLKRFPHSNAWEFEKKVTMNIRFSSTKLLRQFLIQEAGIRAGELKFDSDAQSRIFRSRRKYHRIVQALEDHSHWEVPYSLAWSTILDQKFGHAESLLLEAVQICMDDQSEYDWEAEIKLVTQIKERLDKFKDDASDIYSRIYELRSFIDYSQVDDEYEPIDFQIVFDQMINTSGFGGEFDRIICES